MLAVYESVDLGLVSMLSSCQPPLLDLLAGNQPVLHADPIHDDTVYVYHAFGVHALYLDKLLRSLAAALHGDPTDKALLSSLEESEQTDVRPVVSTFSVERRYEIFYSHNFTYLTRLVQIIEPCDCCLYTKRCLPDIQHFHPHILHACCLLRAEPPL